MTPHEMKTRTKKFGLAVIKLVEQLPKSKTADVLGRQLMRSATSVGANYRAACRSRSDGDFLARMGIVEEESDESAYWLEMLVESGTIQAFAVTGLLHECNELTSIVVASIRTVKTRKIKSDSRK